MLFLALPAITSFAHNIIFRNVNDDFAKLPLMLISPTNRIVLRLSQVNFMSLFLMNGMLYIIAGISAIMYLLSGYNYLIFFWYLDSTA